MAAPTNHWKLGLFVVVGFVSVLVTLVFLGARSLQRDTVTYKTYFDESVQGLEVGSPVKFRGVTIGNVSGIDVASDQRHVEVSCDLNVGDLDSFGLRDKKGVGRIIFGAKAKIALPSDLRMQLGSAGITGVKFISMDFFDEKENPPPVLPFPLPENYVPAAPSTMKNLEDAVTRAAARLPDIMEQLTALLAHGSSLLGSFDEQKLPEKTTETLARVNHALVALETTVTRADVPGMSADAKKTLASMNGAVERVSALLTRLDGERGLFASAQRATDKMGDLAGGAKSLGDELEDTLRDVREAVDSIQRLADSLDTDSDMLLKGRAKKP